MRVSNYFKSLSSELNSLKDRVRNLIEGGHWPTDGEWKESVIRTILKRHLPGNIKVGRGFVVEPNKSSKQIDVLIYDASKPVLYKDGDLVFLTSDAVKGIIEVKSKIRLRNLNEILDKLADNAEFIINSSEHQNNYDNIFVGLFAYESDISTSNYINNVLKKLQSITNQNKKRVVNHLAIGSSFFIRF